ncbi:hypothetical protein JTB14_029604 [Gonioctena quinquepunctata]|nr:hypothetical protein JTB14_029604 [Gonioctena quinquepunctata]
MTMTNEEILKSIQYYQERLERYLPNKNEDKMLYVIKKFNKLPIKTAHLESTGVGRTVNALKKYEGKVGEAAKELVASWKEMVMREERENQENAREAEEEVDSVYSSENEAENMSEENNDLEDASVNSSSRRNHSSDEENNHDRNEPIDNSNMEEKKHSSKKRRYSTEDSDEDKKEKHHSKKAKHKNNDKRHEEEYKRESKSGRDSKHKTSDKTAKTEKSDSKSRSESSTTRGESHRSESKPEKGKKESNSDREERKSQQRTDKKDSHSSKPHSSSDKHEKQNKKEKDESKHEDVMKKSDKKHKSHHHDEKSSSSKKMTEHDSKHKSSKEKSEKKKDKKSKEIKPVNKEKIINGIDSESGASFAEALGMCGPSSYNGTKKKAVSSVSSEKPRVDTGSELEAPRSSSSHKSKSSTSYSKSEPVEEKYVPELLMEKELEPLNINISSLLPEITPNYRPLGVSLDSQPKRVITDDEALSRVMSNRNQRTKVYSGNKSYGKVESLFQICVRILQDNIDALEYTGGVPYIILKPILERATPDQLFNMEHHNPYLIEDTDDLWQLHCQKEFKNKKREEMESWRDMYMRCLDEREARLNAITANIKQSQDKSIPIRTTKLAYIDSVVKPPRNVIRQQAKNGIVFDKKQPSPTAKLSALAKSGEAGKIAVPNPGGRAAERSNSSSAAMKPKKAPLMAKTLSFLKNRFKR